MGATHEVAGECAAEGDAAVTMNAKRAADTEPQNTRHGRAELLAQAEAEFDAVIGEFQTMRRRFVTEGDFESLSRLAGNLQAETW